MGVHSNAEKIVREFGFSPTQSNATTRPGLGAYSRASKADEAVAALSEFMSNEGLIRVYALLRSANQTKTPKFDIGTAGRSLATAIEKKIQPTKEDQETLARIENMRTELDELAKKVKERAPA